MKPIGRNATNIQIAKLLRSVAAALTLSSGDNRFRIIAYDKAADAIEHATSEAKDLWQEKKLSEVAGIGASISNYLDELFSTGKVKHFEELISQFPEAVYELMDVPGIGPKNALKLCKALGITHGHSAVSRLEKAAQKALIEKIEGFGPDSQANILKNISVYKNRTSRQLQDSAHAIVDSILLWMKKSPDVLEINYLGSLRRQAATIGDIDLAVATKKPLEVLSHFTKYPKSSRVLESGEHSASILVPGDIQVDLMVQPPQAYGSLLQHFTGSKFHNVALREFALKKGLSLSEYGIKVNNELKQFADEVSFYNYLGLDWIPPELREGKGEIEAALNQKLPKLIEVKDIHGDLHTHSNFDIKTSHDLGQNSIQEMAQAAKAQGYEYLGITDHNPKVSGTTKSEVISLIKARTEAIKNHSFPVEVFNGLEIDIQPDGKRALPDEALDLLDYAAVSIHSSFGQDRKTATARVLRALDHPKVKFLAHPTGRMLNEREGVDYDWDELFSFCVAHNKWLEINSWPNRLDLPDLLVKDAIKHGVKIIINTDSHSATTLSYVQFGVAVARRGWVESKNVVNTFSLSEFKKLLLSK